MKIIYYCYLILVQALQPHSEASWLFSNDQQQCQLCHSGWGSMREMHEGICPVTVRGDAAGWGYQFKPVWNRPPGTSLTPERRRVSSSSSSSSPEQTVPEKPPQTLLSGQLQTTKSVWTYPMTFSFLLFFRQDLRKYPILRTKYCRKPKWHNLGVQCHAQPPAWKGLTVCTGKKVWCCNVSSERKKRTKKGWLLFLEVLAAKLLSGRLCSAEQHTVLGTAKKSFLTEQNVMIKPGFTRIPTPFMEKIWTNCILFIIFFLLPASAYGWRNTILGLNCWFTWEHATFSFGVLQWCWTAKRGLGFWFSSIFHHYPAFPFIAVHPLQLEMLPKENKTGFLFLFVSLALDICPLFQGLTLSIPTHSSLRLGNLWSSTVPAQAGSPKAGFSML